MCTYIPQTIKSWHQRKFVRIRYIYILCTFQVYCMNIICLNESQQKHRSYWYLVQPFRGQRPHGTATNHACIWLPLGLSTRFRVVGRGRKSHFRAKNTWIPDVTKPYMPYPGTYYQYLIETLRMISCGHIWASSPAARADLRQLWAFGLHYSNICRYGSYWFTLLSLHVCGSSLCVHDY